MSSSSTQIAKRRLLLNITSNIIEVIIVALAGIWLTPYLIKNLGVAVYGLIPMVVSVTAYFGLVSQTISTAVGRFVALSLNKDEDNDGITYFNSAFFGLIFICSVTLVPLLILSPFLPSLFEVPQGYEKDFIILFLLVVVNSFISTITSPFMVSTFVTHSFYLQNIAKIVSKILQLAFVIILFLQFSPNIQFVGYSYVISAFLFFIFLFFLSKKLTPQLIVSWKYFKIDFLKKMGGMGSWMVVDRVGQLLYLNTDLIIINICIGPEQVGYYAPVLQLVLLMRVFTPAISGVFAPVAIELIAKGQMERLTLYTMQSIKFMSLLLALPIGLICGFSEPFLGRWLGPEFESLSPLVWLLLGPQVVFLAVNPLYNINRGMNKVKIPAFATLLGGALNLILSVTFIEYFSMGLYGVALGTVISFSLRNALFHPFYTASNLGIPFSTFIKSSISGSFLFLSISLVALWSSKIFILTSYSDIIIIGISICLVYAPVCYYLLLKQNERDLLISLVLKKKSMAA